MSLGLFYNLTRVSSNIMKNKFCSQVRFTCRPPNSVKLPFLSPSLHSVVSRYLINSKVRRLIGMQRDLRHHWSVTATVSSNTIDVEAAAAYMVYAWCSSLCDVVRKWQEASVFKRRGHSVSDSARWVKADIGELLVHNVLNKWCHWSTSIAYIWAQGSRTRAGRAGLRKMGVLG